MCQCGTSFRRLNLIAICERFRPKFASRDHRKKRAPSTTSRISLTDFGYEVMRFQSEALIGYPVHASLHILGTQPHEIAANGYSLSPGTGPEGVIGDLVYVGAGMPADYAGIDVRGKIVLSDGLAMPGKARAASLAGAIGQIHINDEHIHEMCISPVWGTPTPETALAAADVPAVGITREEGARLKERLGRQVQSPYGW